MENKASITALMSSFARAFHAGNEGYPVFADTLAKKLMTDEEYKIIEKYILGGGGFFVPEKQNTFASDIKAFEHINYNKAILK